MMIVWILWSNLVGLAAALGWILRSVAPAATNIRCFVVEPVLLIAMTIIIWECYKED